MSETSIPVSKEIQKQVKRMKRGGETYDDLMSRLIEVYDDNLPTEGEQ